MLRAIQIIGGFNKVSPFQNTYFNVFRNKVSCFTKEIGTVQDTILYHSNQNSKP